MCRRVFAGECFFLLENRAASVRLRYSMPDEKFELDPHLLIIGAPPPATAAQPPQPPRCVAACSPLPEYALPLGSRGWQER